MKAQDKQKLHQSTIKELDEKVITLQKDLVIKSQELKLGRHSNLKLAKNIRKDIAVFKTIKREKQLEAQSSSKE